MRDPGRKPDASSARARRLVAVVGVTMACGALACGCKRGTPENVETFLGAVERQVDHGVNLALAVCKPNREEQAALRATTTTNAFATLLAQLETCTAAPDCAAPTKTDRTDDAERALAEQPRAIAEATRDALSKLLAKTDAKTRASSDEVLRDATKTMEASAKLARICGSPSQAMDTPQAMTAVDGARAQFRSAVKTMRTEAKLESARREITSLPTAAPRLVGWAAMMQAASADPNAQAAQFSCDNCGGVLLYDPGVSGMKCKHCKAVAPPDKLRAFGPGPREIPLSAGLAMNTPKGLGTTTQAVSCNACGATVNMGPEERSGACIYCASPMVVTVAAGNQLITPESLVPFVVTKDIATHGFGVWLKNLWFRPNDLSKLAKLEKINGVYVPYWTFDAHVRSDWTAERGWNYQETESYETVENGETVYRTRTVTKTRWEWASGWRHDEFDDVLVCGSKGVPPDLVDKLTSFQTTQLVPYSPGYLSGWRAEAYVIDLPEGWKRAQQKMAAEQERKCGSDVGGDTHRALSVRNAFSHETFKHVLLPVYVAAYRYGNKPYQVLINGQTGEVVGKAPYSFWKIFLTIVAVLAVITGISTIFWLVNQPKDPPPKPNAPAATAKPPANTPPAKKK